MTPSLLQKLQDKLPKKKELTPMPEHITSTQEDMDDWSKDNSDAMGFNSAIDLCTEALKKMKFGLDKDKLLKLLDKKDKYGENIWAYIDTCSGNENWWCVFEKEKLASALARMGESLITVEEK